MTAIADASILVNRLTGGNNGNPECAHWWKDTAPFTKLGGVWTSTWTAEGQPGPGVAPTTPENPTRATAGALRMLNPTGGRQRWLRSLYIAGWAASRVLIYDRLLHMGGLSGTSVALQTVGGTLSRYTGANALGNFALAEVYGDVGATSVTLTANYIDSTGAPRVGTAFFGGGSCRNAGQAAVIGYDTVVGSNGVQSVTDVTLSASTLTAGNFGVTICRPLYEISVGSVDTSGNGHGVRALCLEDIELATDACIGVLFMPCATGFNFIRGNYVTVEA